MKKKLQLLVLVLLSVRSVAQIPYAERARNYVRQYGAYAIADQRSTGVPAAVTLGQGILETEAGISELMVKANNHFGVKCKNNWQGETFLHTDDAKDECFKKYADAEQSYYDHSAHLMRNQRYSILFTYSPTDYARWAHGLKKCGYATNPQYAYQLIKIIEEYRLQEFTYAALDSTYKIKGITPDPIPDEQPIAATLQKTDVPQQSIKSATEVKTTTTNTTTTTSVAAVTASAATAVKNENSTPAATFADTSSATAAATTDTITTPMGKVLMVNGLKAIYVHKDEPLLPYAVQYKIRYAHLLEMNDLADEALPFDTYIYLEKKNTTGQKSKHQVKQGETMLMIAQEEGIQLKRLAALNLLTIFEQPQVGTALYLQETASVKPAVRDVIAVYSGTADDAINNNVTSEPATGDLIDKPKEEISFGMGFEAPKEAAAPQKKQVAPQPKPATEITRQPFMKEDPPQLQLKKPATEKEYKKGDKLYIVRKGDTAYSIAKRNGVTVAQLLKWNDIEAQDLKAGQTIRVKE